ncbi:N-acetyltransferase family protein [Methylobacterium sp. CM6257]
MAARHLDVPAHSIRRLWPADRAAVLDYFLRLDPDTRESRFMGNVSEAGVRSYAAQAVTAEGVMYGAFVDGLLRGLGELRPMGPCRSSCVLGPRAEAAFAVEHAFRRRGIGAGLFARIARAARYRGVVDLHVRCLSGNGPMLRLAAKHGAELQHEGAEIDGALHLERPTPFSFWYEGIAEAFDFSLAVSFPNRERSPA